MGAYAYDPIAEDLSVNPLSAKVKSTDVSADSDGFYYKAGQLVEITGDEQVGIATNADKAIGQLKGSLTTKNAPQGIDDSRLRIDVYPFGYKRVLRMVAEGSLTAGTKVCQGTVSKQAVKAMSNVSVSSEITAAVADGAVGMTGTTATEATVNASAVNTVAGGVLPETEIGIVWKGAADGAEVRVLAR